MSVSTPPFMIIPAIDLRGGKCVRLQQGDYDRQTTYDGLPVDVAHAWETAGAPLLHLVDLDGAKGGTPRHAEAIAGIAHALHIPCELGGGIRTEADIRLALSWGVRRVILGTVVAEAPERAEGWVKTFGAEAIVAGLDARDGKIALRGWLEDSRISVIELARHLAAEGVRRFIYTDINTDGMFTGPNLEAVARLCDAVPAAKVIASGGVGSAEHVHQLCALRRANLEGVIVGKALYDGRVTYADLLAAAK